MIVQHFIRQNAGNSSKRILGVTPKAMEVLMNYDWPGNVRELRNAIDYAYVLCPGGGINEGHLPVKIRSGVDCMAAAPVLAGHDGNQRETLMAVLRDAGWNQSAAARKLGVSRVTIWKRMKKYNIQRPE